MMLDRGEQLGWFGSTEIVAEAAIAGLALYLFLVHMFTADKPFIRPQIFKDRNLATGLVFIFIVGIVLLATLALLTPYLQNLMGYPVLTAGMVLAPRGMGTMLTMFLSGRLIGRVDTRLLIITGLVLTATALYEMTGFTPDVSQWTIIRTGFLQGAGLGFIFVPLSTITFSTLRPELRTEATGLFSLMRNIGSSIGISVVISLLASNTQANHAEIGAHLTPFNAPLHAPELIPHWSTTTLAGRAALNELVTHQATIIAYGNDFKLMMLVALAAIPLALLLRQPKRTAAPDPHAAALD
jgi:DHA2 family multidrug resistance protein